MYHLQLYRIDVLYSSVNNECSRRGDWDASRLRMVKILKLNWKKRYIMTWVYDVSLFQYNWDYSRFAINCLNTFQEEWRSCASRKYFVDPLFCILPQHRFFALLSRFKKSHRILPEPFPPSRVTWGGLGDLLNRPFSKMAAENSNKLKLKTHTSTRKNTFTLVTL